VGEKILSIHSRGIRRLAAGEPDVMTCRHEFMAIDCLGFVALRDRLGIPNREFEE
jgi:hypothetical protein